MKKISILTVLILCALKPVFSTDCREITVMKNFEISDFVFIGKIVKVEEKYITIIPYEFFKGVEKELFWAINYDQGYGYSAFFRTEQTGEMWIFYADSVSADTIAISSCGWSCNIYNPKSAPPPPHNPNQPYSEDLDNLTKELWEVSAKQDIILNIETYRSIRKKEIIERDKAIQDKASVVDLNKYIIGLLVLISLLMIIIILQNLKKCERI